MSETGDLLAVVGELDRALVRLRAEDPEAAEAARDAAATLIPALRDPDTLGWYDRFLAATDTTPRDTDLAGAVRSLAAPTASEAVVARRFVATGAVARAVEAVRSVAEGPEHEAELMEVFGTDILDAVLLALSGPGILEGAPGLGDVDVPSDINANAPLLHEQLMDRDALRDAGSLRDFLRVGPARSLLHDVILRAPLPCSSGLVVVSTPSGTEVALTVTTEVCVGGTTFEQATSEHGLLNPVRWAQSDQWCEMTPAPGEQAAPWDGRRRFLEHVALDCDPPGAFPVAVWLDFAERDAPSSGEYAAREYRMAAEQPGPANGAVSIDEGSVVVRPHGDRVKVATTKRVEFTIGIEEAALSVIVCALGYGALAAEFALLGLGDEAHDLACSGGGGAGGPAHAGGAALTKTSSSSGTPVDPVDEPLRALVDTVGDCAAAAGDVLAKAAAGKLTVARLAGEAARSVRRTVAAAWQAAALAAVVADPPTVLDRIEAGPFSAAAGAGPLPPCRLVPGPLQSSFHDLLGPERIGFARGGRNLGPDDALDPGSSPFLLRVRTQGLRAGHYHGDVHLEEVESKQRHAVRVYVQVP